MKKLLPLTTTLLLLSACTQSTPTFHSPQDAPDPTTHETPKNTIPYTGNPPRPDLYHTESDGTQWIDHNHNGKKDIYEDPKAPIDDRIKDLLSQLSVDEKTCQLCTLYGYGRVLKDPLPLASWLASPWYLGIANIDEMHNGIGQGKMGVNDPLAWPPANHVRMINELQRWFIETTPHGIPVDFTNEGVRGCNSLFTTNFPAQSALGATWDRDLISQIGTVTGHEAKTLGYTNTYSPILDLARDPRWGRVVDCYGEDPYLVAELGVRQAIAIQSQGEAATPKHFAVYSEPKGGRDGAVRTDPHIAPREMETLHLYPWKRIIPEAHILGLMCSYNDYDGLPISGAHEFLIDRLRTQYGFTGYIVSDSQAVEDLHAKHRVAATLEDAAAMFVNEGGNVHTNFSPPIDYLTQLRNAIKHKKVSMETLDARVADVLRVKFTLGLFDHPYNDDPDAANNEIHTPTSAALALKASQESIVLLKNANHTLPLSKTIKHLLICGPTAKLTETSIDRYGSTGGHVVSYYEGLKNALPNTQITFSQGCNATDAHWPESEIYPQPPAGKDAAMLAEALAAAKNADVVILCLGDKNDTIGEAKSRTSLDLPGYQTLLAQQLQATGIPVIVVLSTGRAASINWIDRYCPAVLEAWFGGEAQGTALADVLLGNVNPSAKLPVTFPRTVGQLPFNFPYKPSSQAGQSKTVDPNGWGNSLVEGPLYPFAHGLSYTTFQYSNLKLSTKKLTANDKLTITFDIKNTGDREGAEIPQLYLQESYSSVTTYDENLRDFTRVSLAAGETKTVTFTLDPNVMQIINRNNQHVLEPGEYKVMIAASSTDIKLKGTYTVTPQ